MEHFKWKESPTFMYDQTELRGVEGKVGILAVPWKANTANKYMWFLIRNEDDIPSGEKLSVVAVKKDRMKLV
jgi:hypothetical protein